MRHLYSLLLAGLAQLVCTASLHATPPVGASMEAVIEEKGQPVGRTGAGAMMILTYTDETVVLKDGRVTEVRPVAEVSTVPDRHITRAEKQRVAAEDARVAAHAAAAASASWMIDADTALATAQAQDRKVFLFFTGSDWCGWCTKLKREILTQPEFAAYAAEKLVLVEVDFPRSKPQPQELRERNEALAQKYGIRGFPTVVVLDATGKVVGRLGYQRGGPGPFVEALSKF